MYIINIQYIYIYIYIYINIYICMYIFFEVAIESWPKWDLGISFRRSNRPLDALTTIRP